jgi:hypothetical protein
MNAIRPELVAFQHRHNRIDHRRRAAKVGFHFTSRQPLRKIATNDFMDKAALSVPGDIGCYM